MNICFLLGGFTGAGGIGRVTSILANELVKYKDLDIYTMSYVDNGSPKQYNLNQSIHTDYLFDEYISMKKGIFKGSIELRKYLKKNNIDILVACGALYYPISVITSIGLRTLIVGWEHSNVENSKDHSFQKMSRLIGAKYCNQIVTLTKHDEKSYTEKYKITNANHIYNPIDPHINKYVDSYDYKSKKIISVGRLSYQKNFENLIEIANDVLKKNPDWVWDIYGEGEKRPELEQKIKNYNLVNKVFLKGRVDNIYELYNKYSMLVMTSRYEGFPMTLLEGMANGLPLISYDVLTGPNEIIEHGINGFLVEPFKTNEMAQFTNKLIKNSELRVNMSEINRKLCEKYTLVKIVEQWENLFNKLLEQ